MPDFTFDYTAYYRWEWFRKAQWQASFRVWKRRSTGGFIELVKGRGLAQEPMLDCTCGLGLKTIVLKEEGINVEGSDVCALAIECARVLAAEEGHPDLGFFQAAWDELPQATSTRYAAVFNDVVSWIYSDEDMAAALEGMHDVLRPGGILAYAGALPGSSEDRDALLELEWNRMLGQHGKFGLGWRHSDGDTTVTELLAHEKGPDCVDRHHLFLIEEACQPLRLEAMTVRQGLRWGWTRIEPFLRRAGFCEFATQDFTADDGRPYPLVVAKRDRSG